MSIAKKSYGTFRCLHQRQKLNFMKHFLTISTCPLFPKPYYCSFRQSNTSPCPCKHKNWNNGKKKGTAQKNVTLPDDYRLYINRECISFKKIYHKR